MFNQNQLILSFNVRAGARLTIFSFYMFSHANSDTAGATSFASNPTLGIAADYGRAAFDVRHRLFLGGTVSLPHGFRVSPFMVANSGAPFNITLGQDLNGDSIFNDRPAFADGSGGSVVNTSFGSFNTAPIPGRQSFRRISEPVPHSSRSTFASARPLVLAPKSKPPITIRQQNGQRGSVRAACLEAADPVAGRGGPGGISGRPSRCWRPVWRS